MDRAWIVGLFFVIMGAWRLICSELRRRRLKLMLAKLQDDPHAVNASTISLEFPFLFQRSLEIGIMRSFAIPSISRTLRKGAQYLLNPAKRFDDTEILMTEMMLHHADSPRGSLSIRRLNFLHSQYIIDNADYIYVLSLAIVVPPQWASVYGYREWTELEISSYYKAWHDIGVRMGIRDIPPTFSAAAKYVYDYEAKHMVYADSNRDIAEANIKLYLTAMPTFLRPLGRKLLYSLMQDRLREAFGYPKQPTWLSFLSHGILKLHGAAVKWMPPRPLASAQLRISCGGCPAMASLDDASATTFPLSFQRFKPYAYEQGYKISELGGLKYGKLADAFEGSLRCPLRNKAK